MAKIDELLSEVFLMFLRKKVPGFAAEPEPHQWTLAQMVWNSGTNKHMEHTHFDGAMSLAYQALDKAFGRGGFAAINKRLELFEVSPSYYFASKNGYTKGYWLSEAGRKAHDAYMRRHWRSATSLLHLHGTKLREARTLPEAIASTDTNGKTLSAESSALWRRGKSLNLIPINLDTLKRLRKWLEWLLDEINAGRAHADLFMPINAEQVSRYHAHTVKILRHSTTSLAGIGHLNQRYVLAPTGRLFGRGVNLQNAPTLIKDAALDGLWEYDFSNCHFSILAQMAAGFGLRCQAIEHYIDNKNPIRAAIAAAAGISIEQAQECLLAPLYGAKAGLDPEYNEIPNFIGKEAADKLNKAHEFIGIKADIQKARTTILAKWPRTSNGRLVNACGRAISVKEPAPKRLAHLVQGAEAKALLAAINLYPHLIVLLQHDGFAATERLDVRAIEQAVEAELGYRLKLEEEQIRLDPQAQFLRTNRPRLRGRSKTATARKANNGAGFGNLHVS